MYSLPGHTSTFDDLQMLRRETVVGNGSPLVDPNAYSGLLEAHSAMGGGLFSPFALLPLAACLTYIAPACVAAQMGRLWHVLLFSVMAIVSFLHQACDAGSQLQLGGYMACSHTTRNNMAYLNNVWAHFCFLQVCFLVLGPEDPWLCRGKLLGLAARVGDVPLDVLLFARVIPLLVLAVGLLQVDGESGHRFYSGWERGILLNDMLLPSMCVAWWMGSTTRRVQALEVLVRLRYWMRVGLRLVLPAVFLLPLAVGDEVLGWRVLRATRYAASAAAACSVLCAVFNGKVDIADRSPENWLIVPWLLLSQALTLIPTVVLTLSFNVLACGSEHRQCDSTWRWPTLSMAAASQGGRFILAFGTPAMMLATATTVCIIDAAPITSADRCANAAWYSLWDRRLPTALPSAPLKLRETCRWLGCRFLASSVMFGVMAVLLGEDSPVRSALHVATAIPFFGCLWLGIILCTAGADNSTVFGLLRFVIAAAIAKGMIVLFVMFILVNQYVPNSLAIPHSMYASTEYLMFLLLGLWPISWIEDARAIADPTITHPRETDPLREVIARVRGHHV